MDRAAGRVPGGGRPVAPPSPGPTPPPTTRPGRTARAGRPPLRPALAWAVAVAVPLIFLAVFFVYPVLVLVSRGFLADGALAAALDTLTRPRTWRVVGNTFAQAAAGTTVAVLLGVPGAYLLYRTDFPGRTVLRALVVVPFVLPTVVVGVAFRSTLASHGPLGFLGWDGTFAGVVAALVFFNYSVVVRSVGGFWAQLDPRTEEAARALGAGPWRVLRTVTLPALAPAIASAAALVFLFCATAFGVVLVLGGQGYGTIETEIWVQTTQYLDLRAAAVLSVLQIVVVAVVLVLSGRARAGRERALAMRSMGPARPARLSVGRGGRPADRAALAITAATAALLALPLATVLVRSLRTRDGWGLGNYVALGTTGGPNTLSVTVWEATANSLRVAVDATVIAAVVGGLVALVVSRRPRRPGLRRGVAALDAVFMLPLGVSAVTVGFGFLLAMHHPFGLPVDLRSSPALVPIAQAVVAVPLVVRTVLPVLRAVDPRLREAAAVLGAAPGRVLRTVDWPIAARAAGIALGMAFAVSLGEFGATSFLSRPDRPTLPVVVYRLISRPGAENLGMAFAACVVLAVATAGVMLAAERLRARTGEGGDL